MKASSCFTLLHYFKKRKTGRKKTTTVVINYMYQHAISSCHLSLKVCSIVVDTVGAINALLTHHAAFHLQLDICHQSFDKCLSDKGRRQ